MRHDLRALLSGGGERTLRYYVPNLMTPTATC